VGQARNHRVAGAVRTGSLRSPRGWHSLCRVSPICLIYLSSPIYFPFQSIYWPFIPFFLCYLVGDSNVLWSCMASPASISSWFSYVRFSDNSAYTDDTSLRHFLSLIENVSFRRPALVVFLVSLSQRTHCGYDISLTLQHFSNSYWGYIMYAISSFRIYGIYHLYIRTGAENG